MADVSPSWSARRDAVGELLLAGAALWRPQPFKEARPAWCEALPALTARLWDLPDDRVSQLGRGDSDGAELHALLADALPLLDALAALTVLPAAGADPSPVHPTPRLLWEIPGRKAAQIEAFAGAVGAVRQPLLEWCAGKGHLGRLLGARWGVPVHSLEIDAALCAEGRRLAGRVHLPQQFLNADALGPGALDGRAGQHAVALHACGDLHRRLVTEAGSAGLQALDVAPCCYHRLAAPHYQALGGASPLVLSVEDLRLAVTGTATAAPREEREVAREGAWKLAFAALRQEVTGEGAYRSFKPVDRRWRQVDFADWCQLLAAREGLILPAGLDWAAWEALGWQRQREVARLSLVRFAFRRAIEVWLASDLAACLEAQGYAVAVQTFCTPQLTPRNLFVSARR